jgi:hypothetical protein
MTTQTATFGIYAVTAKGSEKRSILVAALTIILL